MDAIVNVALPIFGIIALGFLSGQWRVLGEDSANALNRYVFFFALPPAMFIFTARSDIGEVLNWSFMGAYALAMLLTVALAFTAARLVFRTDAQRGSFHAFMATFANVGYMGIPFFLTAFGGERVLPAIIAGLVGGIPSMILIMTALDILQAQPGSRGAFRRALWKLVARNPFFIATVLGILFAWFAIPVPAAAGNMLDMLALTAGPTALFALGLALVGQPIMGDAYEVSWLTVLKLLVQPALTFLAVRFLVELDPFWAMSAVLLAAMPVGSTAFVLAQQSGVAIRLASATVAVTTMGSIATLTLLMIYYGVS